MRFEKCEERLHYLDVPIIRIRYGSVDLGAMNLGPESRCEKLGGESRCGI